MMMELIKVISENGGILKEDKVRVGWVGLGLGGSNAVRLPEQE